MTITKPGKSNRKFKYACSICDCEFVLSVSERACYACRFIECPSCGWQIDSNFPFYVYEEEENKDERQI